MAIITFDKTTRVLAAAPTSESMLDKVIDTFKVPFMEDNEVLDASGALWAVGTTALVSAVGSSIYTRKRVAENKEPVLKILF